MSAHVKCPACGRKLPSKPLRSWKFRLARILAPEEFPIRTYICINMR